MPNVGLIGLGLMGSALSKRLLSASYEVVGFDVDEDRRRALEEVGGRPVSSVDRVFEGCERIILSLPTTEVVEDVLGESRQRPRESTTIVDTTTGTPAMVEELGRRLAERNVAYLDATISGSSAQVARGEVVVLAGGVRETFHECEDLFATFARRWFHIGGWGAGTRMKLVTNLVLGLQRAALAEGLGLARGMGLDGDLVLQVLADGPAYSKVVDTKGRKMVQREYSPQARLSQHLKDVLLILSEGEHHGVPLPFSSLHRGILQDLEARGLGDLDNSAVAEAFRA